MAPNQITFRAGQMMRFMAARSFALGNTGSTVPKGSEIMFDGTRAEVDGGEHSLPQLRGAIRAGWLVLAENYDENDISAEIPQRAGVQVRHAAQGGNPMQPNRTPTHAMETTESDEREVEGSISARSAATRERNAAHHRGQPVNVGEKVRSQHGFEVVEDQDGVEVEGRTLQTAAGERAKQQRTVLTADRVGSALRQAAASGVITPGKGRTEEEMLAELTEEQQAEYLNKKAALRAQYVDDDPAPRKVGRVKTQKQSTTEGIQITPSVGGGVGIADPTGLGGKPKESVVTQDGITFRNTNGPQRDVKAVPKQAPAPQSPPVMLKDGSSDTDVRRQVAKAMCPDFPSNYAFDQPIRKKMARLQADYEDRPDVILAVYAAESDDFKAKLVEEFPQAFGR